MAEIVGGLFGVTPESLQMQRDKQAQQEALAYAQLQDPFARANYQIYQGASGLGRQLSGLLGAQDPEMMRIQQRQSMLQNLDLSSPESLKQGIQTAMQNKDYQLVSELTNRYQASAKAGLEAQKINSEIQKNLREGQTNEMKNAQSAADMSGAARGSEEWNKTFNAKFNELLAKNPSIDNIGVAVGSQMPVYFDKNTNQQFTIKDGQRVAYNGGVDRTTAKVTATASMAGEKAFSEKLGELDAKQVSDAMSARQNAFATVRSLNQLEKLDDSGLISGSFASGRVGATNLLNTLGLASPEDQQRLATSQNYQKVSGDVILGTLGGKLGAGFSNEDRKFIEGLVPQLETSPAARRQLITFMRNKNMEIADEATRLETYARDNQGLKGFKTKIPLGQSVPTSSLSVDELAKAAGGKIVNGKFVKNQ